LPILLPEAGTVAEIEVGYLPLKVLPLSKEERRRYWNKTVVEFDGEVTLAELVIRGLAERQGFDAVWVTGADRFTKTWPRKPEELPPVSRHWYARVAPVARELNRRVFGKDSKGGCWDIVGCRGDEIVFVESKRMGKDEINDYQRGWLEAAVREGVPLSSFNIIEWG
jgi:hypothetical protein